MGAHFPINEKKAMEKHHFDTWEQTLEISTDQLFSGEIAESAKSKAKKY